MVMVAFVYKVDEVGCIKVITELLPTHTLLLLSLLALLSPNPSFPVFLLVSISFPSFSPIISSPSCSFAFSFPSSSVSNCSSPPSSIFPSPSFMLCLYPDDSSFSSSDSPSNWGILSSESPEEVVGWVVCCPGSVNVKFVPFKGDVIDSPMSSTSVRMFGGFCLEEVMVNLLLSSSSFLLS